LLKKLKERIANFLARTVLCIRGQALEGSIRLFQRTREQRIFQARRQSMYGKIIMKEAHSLEGISGICQIRRVGRRQVYVGCFMPCGGHYS
jgi:hypothetical protein